MIFGLTNTTDFTQELARISDADIFDVKSDPVGVSPYDGFESELQYLRRWEREWACLVEAQQQQQQRAVLLPVEQIECIISYKVKPRAFQPDGDILVEHWLQLKMG